MDTRSAPGTIRLSYTSNPYTREPSNPVLAPGGAGAWDEGVVVGYPQPRKGGGYEVLYRGADAGNVRAVGYASSPDGVHWSKHADNPVLRGGTGSWDAGGVSFGPLIDEGDHYTMFFCGYDSLDTFRFGRATSPDLVGWQREAYFVFGPGPAGSWDERLSNMTVKRQGPGYAMWYTAYDAGGTFAVGYASSPDGIAWERSSLNPVLSGTPAAWDAGGIEGFRLLDRPWVGDHMMAYTGTDGSGNYGIGLAFSPDGITWTKHPANPVILTGGAGSWNEQRLDVFALDFDGGMYKMLIVGEDSGGRRSTGEYYSDNGLVWFTNTANPVLDHAAPFAWDDYSVYMISPRLEGVPLRSFYSGYGSVTPYNGIGTATAAPNYAENGTLTSSVFDAGSRAQWGAVTWHEVVPAGCRVDLSVRTGDTPVPDGSWSAFTPVANGAAVPGGATRYIQYRFDLNGTGTATPEVSNLAIDFEAIPTTWYFAEGYTGSGFDEWITIQNPNPAAANITVTYFTPSGVPEVRAHTAPANSRFTIYVNANLGPDLENSFMVQSDQRVIVERPVYFRYSGLGGHDWRGGHDAMGSTQLSRKWYFAEGYTAENFEEWLTIQNPNPEWATVNVTYFVKGGAPIDKQHRVRPLSRYTINVNQDAGPDLEVSAAIEADLPILAERPMYFNYQGRIDGGHIVMGSPLLSRDWYLAEGATFDPFTEYITIQNPNPAVANVAVAYYRPDGSPITKNHTVPANSRYTINAGLDSGVASNLSAYLHSNQPILVERPMYFNMLYGGLPGGHCAMGVNSPSSDWYFGEGYTGSGFDEWLTVQNPGDTAANLAVTYNIQGEAPRTTTHEVQPQSRYTINVGSDAGKDLQLSAHIQSDQPVVCERPMYFFYQGYHAYNWPGGHDSQGFAP